VQKAMKVSSVQADLVPILEAIYKTISRRQSAWRPSLGLLLSTSTAIRILPSTGTAVGVLSQRMTVCRSESVVGC